MKPRFDRRRYGREYARRRRERLLTDARQGRGTCPRRFGRFGICGGVLQTAVLRGGSTVTTCPRCERFKAGICRDCPQPVAGQVRKARRCAGCTAQSHHESIVAYRTTNRVLVNRRAKLAARKNRQRNNNYKRLWRAAYPEKVAAQKRRYMLRQPPTVYVYQRAYRLFYGDAETHQLATSPRRCLGGCGLVVMGRVKKCGECKASVQRSALRLLGRVA